MNDVILFVTCLWASCVAVSFTQWENVRIQWEGVFWFNLLRRRNDATLPEFLHWFLIINLVHKQISFTKTNMKFRSLLRAIWNQISALQRVLFRHVRCWLAGRPVDFYPAIASSAVDNSSCSYLFALRRICAICVCTLGRVVESAPARTNKHSGGLDIKRNIECSLERIFLIKRWLMFYESYMFCSLIKYGIYTSLMYHQSKLLLVF